MPRSCDDLASRTPRPWPRRSRSRPAACCARPRRWSWRYWWWSCRSSRRDGPGRSAVDDHAERGCWHAAVIARCAVLGVRDSAVTVPTGRMRPMSESRPVLAGNHAARLGAPRRRDLPQRRHRRGPGGRSVTGWWPSRRPAARPAGRTRHRPARAETAQLRTAELEEALRLLGVTEHVWLGYADGGCADADPEPAVRRLAEPARRRASRHGRSPSGRTGSPGTPTTGR